MYGDWELHLSAVHMLVPLYFVYDRVNYVRYPPVDEQYSKRVSTSNGNTLKEGS